MATDETTPWGRVDDEGTVYVREGDGERAVGQYPGASPEEALAYYTRKFTELEGQVGLLEQRVRSGAPVRDLVQSVTKLRESVTGASAVGDLASLLERLGHLDSSVDELSERQSEEQKAAVDEARRVREEIVAEAEAVMQQDPAKLQLKNTGARFDELFALWQEQQRSGPKLPKAEADALWKRFRTARNWFEAQRKGYYARMDAQQKEVRQVKQELIAKAEALISRGHRAIPDYRALLDDWRTAGRAGRKYDDKLWEQFKAAGDALYADKAAESAREDAEYAGNLEGKLALLEEAEALLSVTDVATAKRQLLDIQRRWDAAGRVPRDRLRDVEGRLKKVEDHVRRLDQEHWKRTDPEKEARQSGLAAQLTSAIEKLEDELAAAKSAGDTKSAAAAEEALAARRVWLEALGD